MQQPPVNGAPTTWRAEGAREKRTAGPTITIRRINKSEPLVFTQTTMNARSWRFTRTFDAHFCGTMNRELRRYVARATYALHPATVCGSFGADAPAGATGVVDVSFERKDNSRIKQIIISYGIRRDISRN